MDQVTKLVNTLKERTQGKTLAPEVVVNVLKQKLDASVIRNIGGDAGLLARVKLLLAPPAPAATAAGTSSSSTKQKADDSDDDDDDDSSYDSDDEDDEEDDEEDFDDEEGDDEEEESDFDFDDDSTSDDDDESTKKDGDRRRRQRDEKDASNPDANVQNPNAASNQTPEEQLDAIQKFLKKISLANAVARKKTESESASDYIENVMKPVFAKHELDMNDLSKDAVRRWKVRQEIEQLKKEGADLTLNKDQRRGKPIFNDQGKVVGVVGGAPVGQDAGTVSSSLLDEE